MPRDREPWIKVKIGLRRSGKFLGLPSDGARLGYVYVLLEAKVQRRMGVFDNRRHLATVLGKHGRYVDDFLTASLIHEAPALCPDCKARNPGLPQGAIVVHDYAKEQRDPTHADRQAGYRASVRDGDSDATGTPPTVPNDRDGDGDERTDRVTNPWLSGDVRDGDSDGFGTPDSRARRTTGTETGTTTSREAQRDREAPSGRAASLSPSGAT